MLGNMAATTTATTSTTRRTTDKKKSCLEGDAYIKRYRSWVLLSLALLVVSVSSGLIYGWPALRLQLQEVDGSTLTEERFGLMYTIGSWSTQGGRFFLGAARDHFGTNIVTCFSLLMCVVGLIGVGICDPDQFVVLNVSLFLIGLGSGAQLCLQPVAGLFPNHVGIVLTSLSGAFQISGLMFLILTTRSTSRRASFLAFVAFISVLIVLSAIFLPTSNSFVLTEETATEAAVTAEVEVDDNGNSNGNQEDNSCDKQVLEGKNESVVRYDNRLESSKLLLEIESEVLSTGLESDTNNENDEHGNSIDDDVVKGDQLSSPPTALQQIKTCEYIFLCTWFSIAVIPLQYYVGIIGFQLEELGDDTGLYTDIFAYCFAGAAITAPLAGWIADRFGLGIAQAISTFLLALPIFMLAAKDSITLNAHTVGLAVYGIARMGIYGLYFTNCGKRFGYDNYGTLAGLGLLISAIMSLLQYPLIAWTIKGYSTVVNTFLGAILVLQAPYFIWLNRRENFSESAMQRMQRR